MCLTPGPRINPISLSLRYPYSFLLPLPHFSSRTPLISQDIFFDFKLKMAPYLNTRAKRLRRLQRRLRRQERQEKRLTSGTSAVVNDTTSRSRRGLRDAPASTPAKQAEDGPAKSIKITVKPPVAKVQEATNGAAKPGSMTKGSSELGEVVSGPRGTRAKQTIIDESESEVDEDEEEDEEDDEEGGDEEQDDDEEDEEQDESEEGDEEDEDEEEDAEGENEEVETKAETLVPAVATPARPSGPPPPRDSSGRFQRKAKGSAAPKGRVQALAQSQSKGGQGRRGSAGSSSRGRKADEDDEGDDQGDEDDVEDSDEDEDDESTLGDGSRGSTPDISKMTKRQRSRLEASMDDELLQLPDGELFYLQTKSSSVAHLLTIRRSQG